MDREPHERPAKQLEGDIVVTRVARHYALGRVTADHHTQTPLETENDRDEALRRACILARPAHRVFLYDLAGPSSVCIEIHCANIESENPII